jgi:hypothetical protein
MSITLDDMSALARALVAADEAVEQAEAALSAAKERARQLREETIPSAMQELGLEEIKLDTGQKLSVRQDVYAAIPAAQRDAAYAWLDENGFGGLIKVEVKAAYARGEKDSAVQLAHELRGRGLDAAMTQSVHAQTLKAFLREQIAAGTAIPLDLFGARPVWTAKLTK